MGVARNIWGDMMGYARCPVTGDTLHSGYAFVKFKPTTALLVSERALKLDSDDLAKAVYDTVTAQGKADCLDTSVMRIRQRNHFKELEVKRPGFFKRAGHEFAVELRYGVEYNTLVDFLEQASDYAVRHGKRTERDNTTSFMMDSEHVFITDDIKIKVADISITAGAYSSSFIYSNYVWFVHAWRCLDISLNQQAVIEAKKRKGAQGSSRSFPENTSEEKIITPKWIVDKAESLDEVMDQLDPLLEEERERRQLQELVEH